MKWYCIYLYSASGSMLGRNEFEAEDDRSAMAVAEHLWDACSDVSQSFELWDGLRRVDSEFSRMTCPSVSAEQVMMASQLSLVQREEVLRRSFWALARSERLLQRIRELQSSPVAKIRDRSEHAEARRRAVSRRGRRGTDTLHQ
jgi:hypothetical protein